MMRLTGLFMLFMGLMSSIHAQTPARWAVFADFSFNGPQEFTLLSGSANFDRTRGIPAAGLEFNHIIHTGEQWEWLFGLRYSQMDFRSKYVDTIFHTWIGKVYGKEWRDLGSLYTVNILGGFNYLSPLEPGENWRGGVQMVGMYAINEYSGSEELNIRPTNWGLRLACLVRYKFFELAPYVQFQLQPSVERNYAWEVPHENGYYQPETGSAKSRHGRSQFGLRFGVRF